MALDSILIQFSVVDAAQEGAMRTSHLRTCEIAKFATLRNLGTRNAQPIIADLFTKARAQRSCAYARRGRELPKWLGLNPNATFDLPDGRQSRGVYDAKHLRATTG